MKDAGLQNQWVSRHLRLITLPLSHANYRQSSHESTKTVEVARGRFEFIYVVAVPLQVTDFWRSFRFQNRFFYMPFSRIRRKIWTKLVILQIGRAHLHCFTYPLDILDEGLGSSSSCNFRSLSRQGFGSFAVSTR